MDELLKNLNKEQKEAVCYGPGPLLVLAGPGSGKTRVITHKIAFLIKRKNIQPSRILAITFTNKAANEMSQRVEKLINIPSTFWICTFHSFCAKVLREECTALGYKKDFTIYDTDDQKRAIKHLLEKHNLLKKDSEFKIDPSAVQHAISYYKNRCIYPEDLPPPEDDFHKAVYKIYPLYQKFLFENNAFDFDDLLLKTLELFSNYSYILEYYQEKFQYVLIDEFQDTNIPQYKIVYLLTKERREVCATGDPDQSIYSWRGANIENILNFERDFPETKVIKLEQNYRSTKRILQIAEALISNNTLRKEKKLWTQNKVGSLVNVVESYNDKSEAGYVVKDIIEQIERGVPLNEIVIFYRINALSRPFEVALKKKNIPYRIIGGIEFYKREEIKDLLAYLKLISNKNDNISFLRIINTPPRGIGRKTCEKLINLAQEKGLSLLQAIRDEDILKKFSSKVRKEFKEFSKLIKNLKRYDNKSLKDMIDALLTKTSYIKYITNKDKQRKDERKENIDEFISSIIEFEDDFGHSLADFLEKISLLTDLDQQEEKDKKDRVTLMTLHAAKGLEFRVVYIGGLQEGLLPHHKSCDDIKELEEERRLLFVGITRAKEKLTLSYSRMSYRHGAFVRNNKPSRFLEEIPYYLCNFIKIKPFSDLDYELW